MVVQVVQWNCRSIYRKLPKLKHHLSQLATLPNLLCLQETHLSCKYQPHPPRYTILRKERPPHLGKSGGFAFVSNTISLTHKLPYPLSTGWKMWVLKSTTSTFLMYTIPQTITLIRQFWIKWSGTRKVIMCGDFSSYHGMWGSLSMDANGRTLVSFTESNDYVVLNTSTPTHFYPALSWERATANCTSIFFGWGSTQMVYGMCAKYPKLFLTFYWSVLNTTHNAKHYWRAWKTWASI